MIIRFFITSKSKWIKIDMNTTSTFEQFNSIVLDKLKKEVDIICHKEHLKCVVFNKTLTSEFFQTLQTMDKYDDVCGLICIVPTVHKHYSCDYHEHIN